jgi:DNA mismatch repair ATPase MutS
VGAGAVVSLLFYLASQTGVIELSLRTMSALRAHFFLTLIVFVPLVASFRKRTERIFHDVEEAAHDLALLSGVLRRLEAERFTSPRVAALRADLDVEGWPPSRRIARLNRLMDMVDSRHMLLVHLVGPILLWDIHLAYALEDWRRQSGPAMRRWLKAVGEFEALFSLAAYRYERPRDVFPVFLTDGGPRFEAEALGHPLLGEERTVTNDVFLTSDLQLLIVSGSNMSGKSTLLRSIGVSTVLAQAGAPVPAKRLRLRPMMVGASIRIQDSLQAGASRFYAEITRISRIMKRAADRPPVLFLIDEVLHGTNSHDRRVGTQAIVHGLLDRGAIGLITTHDLALAHITDTLGPRAANVHFEDHLENGRMQFDYRLRPGVVTKSNAIELMRSVGLDVDNL